jgi:2'-5' RNA ligase
MIETIRAFIAIGLPAEGIDTIRRIQQTLGSRGISLRWVPVKNVHLTLKFLGDIRPDAVAPIAEAIGQVAAGLCPFQLQVRGAGVFPGLGKPRVLWAGVGGQLQALNQLHAALQDALARIGVAREKRPFRGHLTIGRVKGRIDSRVLSQALAACSETSSTLFVANAIMLVQSRLQRSGAVYTVLRERRFGKTNDE